MSNGNDENLKPKMSFEDAMKKIATTKVNPAILIEEKGKNYEVVGASGKRVQFVQVVVPDKRIDHFILQTETRSDTGRTGRLAIHLPIHPRQEETDTCFFLVYPEIIEVDKNSKLFISIDVDMNHKNESFELGSVTYKLLD